MPIYEYICDECKHQEEIYYNVGPSKVVHPTSCPQCNSETFHMLPSMFLGDVVDGKEYNGGRKDYKSRMTTSQAADVIMGKRNPY